MTTTPNNSKKEDVYTQTSQEGGLVGIIEKIIRRFNYVGPLFVIFPIFFMYWLCLTFALSPCVYLVMTIYEDTKEFIPILRALCVAGMLGTSYFIFMFSLLFIVPVVNFFQPLKVCTGRGNWYSAKFIGWYYHNALVQLVRYTIADMMCPSPFLVMYYKAMGMKVGKGVVINSTSISDPCLIELEDYVAIGGSATIFAHYGQKGYLIIGKTIIKKKTTIGLKASIMGDVVIGEQCLIGPHQVVLPGSRIPDGTTIS